MEMVGKLGELGEHLSLPLRLFCLLESRGHLIQADREGPTRSRERARRCMRNRRASARSCSATARLIGRTNALFVGPSVAGKVESCRTESGSQTGSRRIFPRGLDASFHLHGAVHAHRLMLLA